MKKLLAMTTALCLCTTGLYLPNNSDSVLSSISASAETSAEDYEFNAETGTIIKYYGNGGSVEIPPEIDGVAVTSIGYEAFSECTSLTSITIPDSVTSIGRYAFYRCESLTSITIPDFVTSIGRYAFYRCESLTSITIPDFVTSIGEGTFYRCTNLESLTISNSVTSIGDYAFEWCENLESITIPDSVTSIGYEAFNSCLSLTGITGYIGSEAERYATAHYIPFISLDGAATTTSTTTTTPITTVTYSYGDVTGDGIIDATDASFVLTAYAKSSTNEDDGMNEEQRKFADVNKDGIVDAVDASAVLTFYALSSTGNKQTFDEFIKSLNN